MNELTGNQIATLLTPTTVCLVTSRDQLGDVVATCAWVNPLSHEPSLIGVCLRPEGRTARALESSGEFCINVLPAGEEAVKLACCCGRKGEGQPERFQAAGIQKLPCRHVGAVAIAQACGVIECRLVDSKVYGDHCLYVGQTLYAAGRDVPALLMEGRSAFGRFKED